MFAMNISFPQQKYCALTKITNNYSLSHLILETWSLESKEELLHAIGTKYNIYAQ